MNLAIIPASGIGDCLLFSTLGAALQHNGWKVTIYSDHGQKFGTWLAHLLFRPQPNIEEIHLLATMYDAILLQHDNSQKAKLIEQLHLPLFRFYGSHVHGKHGCLDLQRDYICNRSVTMRENLTRATHRFFGPNITPIQELTPPQGLIHRRFPKRIAIHPTASTAEKCWPRDKFLKLKSKLIENNLEPHFVVSPREQAMWPAAPLSTLGDLASFLYESGGFIGNDSGPGHLASLLKLPHLIIGGDGLQMPLWRTGWHPGRLLTPPRPLMHFKAIRKRWHFFITPENVINKFINIQLYN